MHRFQVSRLRGAGIVLLYVLLVLKNDLTAGTMTRPGWQDTCVMDSCHAVHAIRMFEICTSDTCDYWMSMTADRSDDAAERWSVTADVTCMTSLLSWPASVHGYWAGRYKSRFVIFSQSEDESTEVSCTDMILVWKLNELRIGGIDCTRACRNQDNYRNDTCLVTNGRKDFCKLGAWWEREGGK